MTIIKTEHTGGGFLEIFSNIKYHKDYARGTLQEVSAISLQ